MPILTLSSYLLLSLANSLLPWDSPIEVLPAREVYVQFLSSELSLYLHSIGPNFLHVMKIIVANQARAQYTEWAMKKLRAGLSRIRGETYSLLLTPWRLRPLLSCNREVARHHEQGILT
jgi:hypothetical protein